MGPSSSTAAAAAAAPAADDFGGWVPATDRQQQQDEQDAGADGAGPSGSGSGARPPPPSAADEAAFKEFLSEVREVDRDNEVNRILWAFKLNPFEKLNLRFDAAPEEIKKQYRKVSLLVHPDKCSHPQAAAAFDVLGAAHKELLDEQKREGLMAVLNLARDEVRAERAKETRNDAAVALAATLHEVSRGRRSAQYAAHCCATCMRVRVRVPGGCPGGGGSSSADHKLSMPVPLSTHQQHQQHQQHPTARPRRRRGGVGADRRVPRALAAQGTRPARQGGVAAAQAHEAGARGGGGGGALPAGGWVVCALVGSFDTTAVSSDPWIPARHRHNQQKTH